MILRLIIAFTRWVWNVSPAFVTADSGKWYMVMIFGMVLDAVAVTGLIALIVDILNRR